MAAVIGADNHADQGLVRRVLNRQVLLRVENGEARTDWMPEQIEDAPLKELIGWQWDRLLEDRPPGTLRPSASRNRLQGNRPKEFRSEHQGYENVHQSMAVDLYIVLASESGNGEIELRHTIRTRLCSGCA
jgi:hypothetical protein